MDYYQGKGHYQKTFNVTPDPDRRYFLKVDAANKAAHVSLNGTEVGSHAGGYSAFTIDITSKLGECNRLEITTDNSRQDIAPTSADFTFMGGIYRDVWLISTPLQHFNLLNHGSDGIFIATPAVSAERATLQISAEVTNDAAQMAALEVTNTVKDPYGNIVLTHKQRLSVESGATQNFKFDTEVKHPQLWTPETPLLYTVETTLHHAGNGKELESLSHRIGFRWFAFDGDKGFMLNGKAYKLRGVNRHQDQLNVGVALPDEAHRRDIALIKDLGCNFLRIAHYPQDDALLDACDELGLLAWEEIPIVNRLPQAEGFEDNCETNLREMIRQHYNHPSVIAWGYMNEILLQAPADDKPEWPAGRDRILKLAHRLEDVLHAEDPYRSSVMAFHGTNRYNEVGLNITDVVGWNLYQGWYGSELEDFDRFVADQHRRHPDKPLIISEWGAGSDRRLHADSPRPFDFSIEYQQRYAEHYIPVIERNDYISGSTYWNFVDFNVATRQESMPRTNNKGLFYSDRTPKDVAYYMKAMYRKDIPIVHIATRDHAVRTACPDSLQTIKVYTNAPEVELTVNGVSAGTRKAENCTALYRLRLDEGTSALTAHATRDGQNATDATTLRLHPLPRLEAGEELAINVGSNCQFTSTVSHLTWQADHAYTPGSWGHVGGSPKSTTGEIKATNDGPLYQTWCEGLDEYRIDVPKGQYEVELLFADASRPGMPQVYLLGKDRQQGAGPVNRFDIRLNGTLIEQGFSPAPEGRYREASRRRYFTESTDGRITLHFTPVQGKSLLAGIKIRKTAQARSCGTRSTGTLPPAFRPDW